MLEQNPLPYSLFLIPYLLFKSSSMVETVGYGKYRNVGYCKTLEQNPLPYSLFLIPYLNSPLGGFGGLLKKKL
jgi:hypothetical protein